MQTHLPFDAPAPPEASPVDAPEASAPRHTGVTLPRRPMRALDIFRGPFGLMIVESAVCVTYERGRPRRTFDLSPRKIRMWTWDGMPANDAPRSRGSYGPHPGIHPDAR